MNRMTATQIRSHFERGRTHYQRDARTVERELRETRERLLRYTPGSRMHRMLDVRRQALALELGLTVGALSLGAL